MLHLKRPPKPDNFDFDKDIQECRAKAKQEVQRYRDELAQKAPKPRKPDFPNAWSTYKAAFAEAQYGKCGYCEIRVIAGFPGDVDHFRPKGEVWTLPDNPDDWGRQRPNSVSVEGRKHSVISDVGYWWLAYEWDNWLLCCSACNSGWKGSYFPVAEAKWVLSPDQNAPENPLLLNPFDGPDPQEHLYFGDLGEVMTLNDSSLGRETIKTCGLDRPGLRQARQDTAWRAHHLVQEVLEAHTDEKLDEALSDLHRMVHESCDYAGMVRAILLAKCGVRWDELEGIDD
jgi:hypothetical protein